MDYDGDLQVIHMALMKADNMLSYKKLTNRGGNEDVFDNVVKILEDALVRQKFVNPDGSINPSHFDIMRRTTFFLVLNSDLGILKKLAENDYLEHLVWKAPEIPKCLLIHIIWKLKLDIFLCEMIKYSNQELSLQLLEMARDNMIYTEPEESVIKVNMLVSAAYEAINRMFSNIDKINYKRTTLIHFYTCIYELLKFYHVDPPNKCKMSTWKKKKKVQLEGISMYNLMDMTFYCFEIFLKDVKDIIPECDLYKCTFSGALDLSLNYDRNNTIDMINEHLNKVNQLLTMEFKEAFQNITVDKLCCWFDILVHENPPLTLQSYVGYKAYELEQLLVTSVKSFDKELLVMLSGLSQKPKTLLDVISESDYRTICENAQKCSPEQHYWVEALVKNKIFLQNEMLIDFVRDNVSLVVSFEVLEDLFQYIYDLLKKENLNKLHEKLRQLAINCFAALNLETIKRIILNIVDSDPYSHILQLSDYSTKTTTYFNKVIENEGTFTEMYCLFIQNPLIFYEKCLETSVHNMKQVNTITNILGMLKLCDKPLELKKDMAMMHADKKECGFVKIALDALQNLNKEPLIFEHGKQSFLQLLTNMISENILDPDIILTMELFPKLSVYLKDGRFDLCQVYWEAIDSVFIPKYILRTVSMLAVTMEKCRWDIWHYNSFAVVLLNYIITLVEKYLVNFQELYKPLCPEYTQLCRNLDLLSPINRHHFKALWGTPFETQQFFTTGDFKTDVHDLALVVNRMTYEEVKQAFKSLCGKYPVYQSVHVLCQTYITSARIVDNLTYNVNEIASCLLYTCRNVAGVLMDYVCSDDSLPSMIDVMVQIIRLVNSRPEEKQDETLNCFVTVLSKILAAVKDKPDVLKMVLFNHPFEKGSCRHILEQML